MTCVRGFPSPDDVAPEARERASALKDRFLATHPTARPGPTAFHNRYRQLFSKDDLPSAPPDDLKYFANSNAGGANAGNMSVFNIEWNRLGPEEAASRVRESIDYLLYGPEGTHIEDRLTNLINGERGFGMKGFREALLTKVLCTVERQRFIPILVYTGKAGKKQYAKWVYDIDLPDPESVSWTIGRLIFWSNDLFMDLAGAGFEDAEHAAEFLWWAKDLVSPPEDDR